MSLSNTEKAKHAGKTLLVAFAGGVMSAYPDVAAGSNVVNSYMVQHCLLGGAVCLIAAIHKLPEFSKWYWVQLIGLPVTTAIIGSINQVIDNGGVITLPVLKQAGMAGASVAAALYMKVNVSGEGHSDIIETPPVYDDKKEPSPKVEIRT